MWRVLIYLLLLGSTSFAYATDFNAGFVEGLWLSDESIFVGDTVRAYIAVRNNTEADLSGRVEFYDGEALIGRRNVEALSDRIVETWADWEPVYGEHTLTATLSRIELQKVGSSSVPIEVTSSLAKKTVFVDRDSDKDGVGNESDSDDDNDGIADEEEKENGTDPLDPDDPKPETENTIDDEDTDGNTPDQQNTTTSGDINGSNADKPEGLEQFLTENSADNALSSMTDIINTTKQRLDQYRASRNDDAEESHLPAEAGSNSSASSDATSTKINSLTAEQTTDGFGEVSRSTNKKPGIVSNILGLLGRGADVVYTFVLFLLSQYLAHPIIVQLSFLFLILFSVYKLARRIGRRPS